MFRRNTLFLFINRVAISIVRYCCRFYNYSMKKVLLFAFLCLSLHGVAQELPAPKYVGATPASGSEITTDSDGNLNIVLQFDLSDVEAQYGPLDEYGIGYQGNTNPWNDENQMGAVLFEGPYEEGKFMQKVNTQLFTGKSVGFKVGNTLDISFPSVTLTPGQTYTVVINHNILVWKNGTGIPITRLTLTDNPIILSYTAKKIDTGVVLESCSMKSGTAVETVGLVTYQFNNEIEVVPGANALIMEGEAVVAQSPLSISETNGKTAVADFGGKTVYLNRNYVLVLPENSVCLKGDNSWFNVKNHVPFTGSSKGYAIFNSSVPESGTVTFPTQITINFDIADDAVKIGNIGGSKNYMDAYDEIVSEETFISKLTGVSSEDGRSVSFTFSPSSLIPEKKYVFDIPADQFKFIRNHMEDQAWSNEAVRIEVTTPSIEEAGLPPVEFGEPIIGKHGVSTDTLKLGASVESLNYIEIGLKDLHYNGGGIKCSLEFLNDRRIGYLYDITDGTEVLLKEVSIILQTRENPFTYYGVIQCYVQNTFFEGHKYRLVIPENTFDINSKYKEYVEVPEFAYEFYGAAPTEVKLVRCSLEDNTERSTLCDVIYEFKGEFEFNPDMKAKLYQKGYTVSQPLIMTADGGKTIVTALIHDKTTGEPISLREGDSCSVTLPAGTLYYSGDPSIRNEEIVRTIKAVAPAPAVEFVELTVSINGSHATINKAAKGQTTQVSFTPDEYWQVKSVNHDGNNVTNLVRNGVYTTPVLSQNTTIEATIEYAGEFMVEHVSGIFSIPESSIKVRTENGVILVEGVSPDDLITVYNMAGMTICTVTPEHDIVKIRVEPGQAYIVRVNRYAAKVMP